MEYREAVRLKPDEAAYLDFLGFTLWAKGDPDGALAACRQAIRGKPGNALYHRTLGLVLRARTDLQAAIAAYREVVRLKPDDVWSRMLASRLERLAVHGPALETWLRGDDTPSDAGEAIALALVLYARHEFTKSVRLFDAAFVRDPTLAADATVFYRHVAAQTAALAASQTNGRPVLDDGSRAMLRARSLSWLRDDLAAWNRRLDSNFTKVRAEVGSTMGLWRSDFQLAGVRDPEALSRLPEAERGAWRAFWKDVVGLQARAAKPSAP